MPELTADDRTVRMVRTTGVGERTGVYMGAASSRGAVALIRMGCMTTHYRFSTKTGHAKEGRVPWAIHSDDLAKVRAWARGR